MNELVVDALATYRLTRLVQRDTFPPAAAARAKVIKATGGADWAYELLQDCPWCASIWVGLAVVAARRAAPRAWGVVASALAASAVSGFLSEREKP